jgi:L-ascorbate metabolism protein UlaG (beta-lactamase superfamily)
VFRMTYIGGPTALFEIGQIRLLTDPTFDPAGSDYDLGRYALHKLRGPAIDLASVGEIDAVLLSHDHHYDNLDRSGRQLLATAGRVLTTVAAAQRLGGNAVGLADWQSTDISINGGRTLRVTGTPARHGPPDGDRGPVTGFVLITTEAPDRGVYISGDTVWFEQIDEVARRFEVKTAVLFMGAARIPEVGTAHLTMSVEDGVRAARAFSRATIVPLHFDGWGHLTESRSEIQRGFADAGLERRLLWLTPGAPVSLEAA